MVGIVVCFWRGHSQYVLPIAFPLQHEIWYLRFFRKIRQENSFFFIGSTITGTSHGDRYTWFVPKLSILIFLCTNWQHSTSLMYIGTLVVILAACPYLFQLDWLSHSCATAVCVWPCFLTSLHLRCRKISNSGTLSNFV